MKWKETRQSAANNNEAKAMSTADAISAELARDYATRLFQMRVKGWGDESEALGDVANWSRMMPRSFKRLMTGETKEPSLGMYARVRAAYLDYCHRLVKQLEHEIEVDRKVHGDAALEDIGREVAALADKVRAAKARPSR